MSYLDEFRATYPKYAEWDDLKLASALYEKYGEGKDKFDFWLDVSGKGERATPFEVGTAGLKSSFQTLGAKVLQELGYEEEAKKQLEESKARQEEVAGRYKREVPSYTDIGLSPSKAATFGYETFMESVPSMAPSAVGAAAGFLVGGPLGAGVGATALGLPTYTASNIQSQIDEGRSLQGANLGTAALAAAPQAALDFLSLGRLVQIFGRAGAGSLIRRAAVKGVEGTATESISETLQQSLEILQADPEKFFSFSPEVKRELAEAAVAGGILGGAFGVAGSVNAEQKPAAPAAPVTPPTAPVTPPTAPVVPPITGQEPAAENAWIVNNRDALQKFNDTPILTPISDPKGVEPAPPPAGSIRFYFDPTVAESVPSRYFSDVARLRETSPQSISFFDVPADAPVIASTQSKYQYDFQDKQIETQALASAQNYEAQPADTAPATFASLVDKALYAYAKKTNNDDFNLAKDYLTQGLGLTEQDIDIQSKDVETKVDKYLAERKKQIETGTRKPDERIITPKVTDVPSVATFPSTLSEDKIAGIDVNTTDPQEQARLKQIVADTKTNYAPGSQTKLEKAFPGITTTLRKVQERLFPGLTFQVSTIEDPTSYGYMSAGQYPDNKTFALNFSLKALGTPDLAVRTLFHEMFHVMEYTWLTKLPKDQLDAIIKQYVNESVPAATRRIAQTSIQERVKLGVMDKGMIENPEPYLKKNISVKDGKITFKNPQDAFAWTNLTLQDKAEYYFGFSEWVAEKGAEWVAGSNRKVSSQLDNAFKKLYKELRRLYYTISEFLGAKPDQGAFEQLLSEIWGQRDLTPEKDVLSRRANLNRANAEAEVAGVPIRGVPSTGQTTPSRKQYKPQKPRPLSSELPASVAEEERIVVRKEPGYAGTGDRLVSEAHPLTDKDVEAQGINPALVGPNVPPEMQQIGAFTTARKNQGLWGRLFDFITGRVEGESHAQAMFRNSVASAIPFLSRVEYKEVGRTIERMQNVQGRISGLISVGFMDYNPTTGDLKFNNKYGGLIKIFDRIGTKDEDAFQEYAIARREIDLRKAGKSGLGYKVTDSQLKKIVDSAPTHFKEVATEFENYNKGMVQFSLDSGLIPQELADRFMSMFYVPFYRVQDDGTANMGTLHPKITKALEDPKGISAFNQNLDIGGMVERGFYDNILRNYSTIVAAGLKNIAYNSVAKAALTADGKAIDTSIAEPVGKPSDGVITYRVNGGDQYLKINDVPMFQSLAAMSPKQLGAFTEAASKAANVLRTGVTIAPPFQIANLWRGIIDTYVKTGMPITDLIAGTFKNFREVYRKGPSYQAILAATGFGGYGYGAGFRDQAEFMRRAYTTADISKPWGLVMKALDKLEHIGEATEMASRVTYRDYLVKKGVDPTTAAYEAVNLTNFNRSGAGGGVIGNTLMHLIPMIPFLNARVQGLYRLIEKDTAGAPKSWLAKGTIGIPIALVKRGLQLTAIELALNMIYGDEDWYKKLSVEDKVANNYFRFNDTVIAAPRAFEIGSVYGAIPALILDSIREKEGSQFTDGLIHIMSSTFLFNPIPQAVKPIAEVMVNKDMFTWRDIETIADKNRLRKERFDESTTEVAKALAEVTPFSPKQADILVRGYLGTMGTVFASVVDGFVSEAGVRPQGYFGDPVSKLGIAANATGLSRFVKDPELLRNRFIKDFYDMKLSVTQITRSIDDAGVAGNLESLKEKLKNDPAAQAVSKTLNKAESQINDINKQMNSIRLNPNLPAEEKTKRLTALRNLKNQTAEQAFEFGRKYGYD